MKSLEKHASREQAFTPERNDCSSGKRPQGAQRLLWLSTFVCVAVFACAPKKPAMNAGDVASLRSHGPSSRNETQVASWLLSELLAPGGRAKHAARAQAHLTRLWQQRDPKELHPIQSGIALGLEHVLHGRLDAASGYFMAAAATARLSKRASGPLLAWYALEQAISYELHSPDLWNRWRPWVEEAIREPQRLGYRARDALTRWAARKAWEHATTDISAQVAKRYGCVPGLKLAGPFGSGSHADILRPFPAERIGAWPQHWQPDNLSGKRARIIKTEQDGCTVSANEPVESGVYYLEAVVHLKRPAEAIVLSGGALKLWVDGAVVLDRNPRTWGAGTREAAGIWLDAGPHRIRAKVTRAAGTLRLLNRNGTPLQFQQPKTSFTLPSRRIVRQSFEPNLLGALVHSQGVLKTGDPLVHYLAAELAHKLGADAAAALLVEPLVKDLAQATGPALAHAAKFVKGDPIFNANQTEDLIRELHTEALKKDSDLWVSALHVVRQKAKNQGVADAVKDLKRLSERYRQVPALLSALSTIYGKLGWSPEQRIALNLRSERFPKNVDALYSTAQLLEESGDRQGAQELYARIQELDPDSEITAGEALRRKAYAEAIAELKRLKQRRPFRKQLSRRLLEVKRLSGAPEDGLAQLREEIKEKPQDGSIRLKLADAEYASGDHNALNHALVDAIQAGASSAPLKNAIDLVEGLTELERFRLDGNQVILKYEREGKQLPGNAARVLDYLAVWVRSDGSARSLEHQIVRIQSEEAIRRFAEQELRASLVLGMRVIKQDGRVLEPEPVKGKPTVTFPHLEVGDYIETELVFGREPQFRGLVYDGPHWMFREKDVAYARSEFVLVTPADRKLDVEITGAVPKAELQREGHFQIRRWRMDHSPAAPNEPLSVPAIEYLPSVRVSWGLSLSRQLRTLSDQVQRTTPIDPRIVRVAQSVVRGLSKEQETQRARALYRWVLDNVREGRETDGRRVIIGKRGNRWRGFISLCEALAIPTRWAVARNQLAPNPRGPASEAALFNNTVLRVGEREPVWLTLAEKHTPFGYLPVGVRSMKAYLLAADEPQEITLPGTGELDQIAYEAKLDLARDGSASIDLTQTFTGAFGASVRKGLAELGTQRQRTAIESNILSRGLRGARLTEFKLVNLDNHDAPMIVRMQGTMAQLADQNGTELRLNPPYAPGLRQYATLPMRQTPLLIGSERRYRVRLRIKLPAGAVPKLPKAKEVRFREHRMRVRDRLEQNTLVLDRDILIKAGRISPDEYAKFVRFTREADGALSRGIRIPFN